MAVNSTSKSNVRNLGTFTLDGTAQQLGTHVACQRTYGKSGVVQVSCSDSSTSSGTIYLIGRPNPDSSTREVTLAGPVDMSTADEQYVADVPLMPQVRALVVSGDSTSSTETATLYLME